LLPSILIIIGIGLTAYAQQQQTQVFIVGPDGTTHEANLKATKNTDDGQLRKISTFKIKASNVVQINQGKDLIVFTANPAQDQVQKVKIRNTQSQLTELERVTGVPNTFSLVGYPVGVYVLDVIVQLSGGRQGAYETILVIIPPNQQPQPINFPLILQIIQTVIDTDIRVIIDDDNGDDGTPEEICDNGKDDDGDGLVDSEDPDCPEEPTCDPLEDPKCEEPCPPGYSRTPGGVCELIICPADSRLVDGVCEPIDPCVKNPELPQCAEPCPEGRPRNPDGTCPPTPPPDPCEENPDLPECQPPPGPCPEGLQGHHLIVNQYLNHLHQDHVLKEKNVHHHHRHHLLLQDQG
jgi:hypothetical protein